MPERNAPCPCGSGKKHKRCCGLSTAHACTQDLLAINRAVAYKGDIGRRRQAFCKTYASAKKDGIAEVEIRLRKEVADMGKAITCHKGCGHCCDVWVFANLQESENIVHYLYEHDDVLQYYLRQYPRWKQKIDSLGAIMPRLDKAQEKILFGTAAEDDQQAFDEDLAAYAALHNSCPFLQDGACSIYEVRPYACAGVVSVSPPESCMRGHPTRNQNILVKADFLPQNDMPYFLPTKAAINFGCMPALVQQILKYGYAFLSTIEGLEEMHHLATDDPEVKTTLAQMGIK